MRFKIGDRFTVDVDEVNKLPLVFKSQSPLWCEPLRDKVLIVVSTYDDTEMLEYKAESDNLSGVMWRKYCTKLPKEKK